MTIEQLIQQIKTKPETIDFSEVIKTIGDSYQYSPSRFINGIGANSVTNEAGVNEGSCKIFFFAHLNNLNKSETLACFGQYYREDVLQNPNSSDHANIRNFMLHGWDGIQFDSNALAPL